MRLRWRSWRLRRGSSTQISSVSNMIATLTKHQKRMSPPCPESVLEYLGIKSAASAASVSKTSAPTFQTIEIVIRD